MRKLFNIGDRVRVYCSYGAMKATVIPSEEDDRPILDSWHEPSLHVQFDESFNIDGRATIEKRAYVHPKQCRLLRKKPERKNLSADDIARAWNNSLSRHAMLNMAADSVHFITFCQSLGFKELS